MLLLYDGLQISPWRGKPISAIIDTAAMITLINESIIPDNQLATNELKLKGIGSQILHGRLIKGVAFAVGNLHISWDCCAVPIDDEMILGLDFLAAYHGIVNIKECTISLENNTFPVKLISDLKQHPNSYVRIQRTMCVQPNTIVRIPVQLENHLTGKYVVSPVRLKLGSHTLGRGNTTAMSFINDSSTAVKFKEGTVVGEAEAYAEICQEEESPVLIRKLQTSSQVDDELPEHLTDLYNRSSLSAGPVLEVRAAMQVDEKFEPGGLRACNWAVGNSPAEVRSLQEEDPDLCPIIKWLECNIEPKQAELRLQSPGTRTLWLSRKNLQFIDRVLHYKWDGKANRSLCLVVPQGLQRTNEFEAIALDDLDLTQPAIEQGQGEGPDECQDLHKTKVNDDESCLLSDAPVQTRHGRSVKAPSKYKDFV
uniref:Peptidase A2 domain-containing protein n=1 Tax=Magallana gigas TaxID=29159 RepID=A0A8W8IJN6_MAGGI